MSNHTRQKSVPYTVECGRATWQRKTKDSVPCRNSWDQNSPIGQLTTNCYDTLLVRLINNLINVNNFETNLTNKLWEKYKYIYINDNKYIFILTITKIIY